MLRFLHTPEVHYFFGKMGLVLLSALLGAIIGYERERHERPAGMRTHMLVAMGATLITVTDTHSGGRIAAQIVTGVGFLGAGTIIRENGGVHGLTTAASVWAVAGIGIAVGTGFPYTAIAVATTLLVVFTLTGMNRFEEFMNRRRKRQAVTILLTTTDPLADLAGILHTIRKSGVHTHDVDFQPLSGGQKLNIEMTLAHGATRDDVDRCLQSLPQLVNYEWKD